MSSRKKSAVNYQNIDRNRSSWIVEAQPYEAGQPWRSGGVCDIAIIGGGLTGVSAAWHLSERFPRRSIRLFEARALANGASGRNGGQVLTGINGVSPDDPESEKRIYEVTRQGVDLIEEFVRRVGSDAGFSRRGSLSIYTDGERAEAAHADVERAQKLGLPLRWMSAAQTGLRGNVGGAFDPNGGRVNSAALVRGLRRELIERGVLIHENTPVTRVIEGRDIRLVLTEGEVRAQAIVLATNAYSGLLGYFRSEILPLHAHVVATEAVDVELAAPWTRCDAFSDDLDRIAYGCRTGGGRIVFGGGSNGSYDYRFGGRTDLPQPPSSSVTETIRETMLTYLPQLRQVPIENAWSGLIDLSFDRSCSIGVRGDFANVYYAIGYSGHGIAMAALAGRVIADLYSDFHDPWRDLPFYQRRLRRIPPEPMRWIGYQAYTRLTGRSPRR